MTLGTYFFHELPMYTHILVPVDGSPTSECGLSEAIQLAQLTGARLRLIHVLEDYLYVLDADVGSNMSASLRPTMREGGHRLLARCSERVKAAGLAVEAALIEDIPARVSDLVVADATQWGADLIVLGTHGRRGIGRLLMGSNAEQIARTAPTPVLLVRFASRPLRG